MRHTPLDKPLSRIWKSKKDADLVVHLEPGGVVRLVEEPRRRLRRNEVLPEVVLDLDSLWEKQGKKADKVAESVEERVRARVLPRVAIASCGDETRIDKVAYRIKAALYKALDEEFGTKFCEDEDES